jgi:hypothetical protein
MHRRIARGLGEWSRRAPKKHPTSFGLTDGEATEGGVGHMCGGCGIG